MQHFILLLKISHRILLSILLFAFAVIPFHYQTTLQTAFVFAPILFILVSIMSIQIESFIKSREKIVGKNKIKRHCRIKYCPLFKGLCC
jgi:hypothetical protein